MANYGLSVKFNQHKFIPKNNFSGLKNVKRHIRCRSIDQEDTDMKWANQKFKYTRRWYKNIEASDSMQEAFEMVNLSWILRNAIKLLNVMDIECNGEYFKTVIKAGGILDVKEIYRWDGTVERYPRRDKRIGYHEGKVIALARGPCISVKWNDPFAGECTDTFVLKDDGKELIVETEMKIKGFKKSCIYKTIYFKN